MGLVVAVGFGALRFLSERMMTGYKPIWLLRAAALALLLWNGFTVGTLFQGEIILASQVVRGEVNPVDFRQGPWELLLSAPLNQPILTEEAFAPMLVARPELYVSDDWRGDEAFEIVQLHVNVALFSPEHQWVDRLLDVGFVVTREVGGAVLLERKNPSPALPPVTPL